MSLRLYSEWFCLLVFQLSWYFKIEILVHFCLLQGCLSLCSTCSSPTPSSHGKVCSEDTRLVCGEWEENKRVSYGKANNLINISMECSCLSCAISAHSAGVGRMDGKKCAGREGSCHTRGCIQKDRQEGGSSAVWKYCSPMLSILLLGILPSLAWPLPLPWLLSAFPLLSSLRSWRGAVSGAKVEAACKKRWNPFFL